MELSGNSDPQNNKRLLGRSQENPLTRKTKAARQHFNWFIFKVRGAELFVRPRSISEVIRCKANAVTVGVGGLDGEGVPASLIHSFKQAAQSLRLTLNALLAAFHF